MGTLTRTVTEASVSRARSVRWPYLLATTLVVVFWIAFHIVRPTPRFPLDDPYITLHSAQVLHSGVDPNYPGISPLYGATSAPFLALVYLLLFPLPPLLAIESACWLGLLAYVLALVYTGRSLRLSNMKVAGVVVLGLTASFIPFHLINGLETSWAMAATVWTLSLGRAQHYRSAALAAGAAAAVRPDLLPFTFLMLVAFVYLSPKFQRRRALLTLIPLAMIPIVVCMAWYLVQTGHLYPLTGTAKLYYIATGNLPTSKKIATELVLLLLFLFSCGPLLLSLKRIARQPIGLAILAFSICALVALYVQFPSAMANNRFRYMVILSPMLVWATAVAAHTVRGTRLFVICLSYSLFITLPYCIKTYLEDCRYYDNSARETAAWCNQNLPTDARILVQDAGYIAYATKFHIVDFVGLKTPEAIQLNRQYTWPTAGANRAGAIIELGLRTHSTHLIILSERSDLKDLPEQMQARGWRLDLLSSWDPYRVYRITAPNDSR